MAVTASWHGVSCEPLLGPIDIGDARPDWIIAGDESGPRHRFIGPDSLRDQCTRNGTRTENGGSDIRAAVFICRTPRYGLRVGGRDIIDMYEQTRAAGFGKEVRRRIMIGTYVLSAGYYDAYYLRAQKVRTLIKRDFEDCFRAGVNAVLTPTTPSAAFAIGEKTADPIEMYLNDVFTVTVNMAGLPGISVPAGLDSQGLPLGLQLIGRPFDEETLFSLGAVIEEAAGRFTPEKWW